MLGLRIALAYPFALLVELLAIFVIWLSDGELSMNFDYMNKKSKDHWSNQTGRRPK